MFNRLKLPKQAMGLVTTTQFKPTFRNLIFDKKTAEKKEQKETKAQIQKPVIEIIEFPLSIVPHQVSSNRWNIKDSKDTDKIRADEIKGKINHMERKSYYSRKSCRLNRTLLRFNEGKAERICEVLETIGTEFERKGGTIRNKARLIRDIENSTYLVTKSKRLDGLGKIIDLHYPEFIFGKKIGLAITEFMRYSRKHSLYYKEIIQPYIPGAPLKSVKTKKQKLHWRRWLDIVKKMIYCVKALHDAGIIHSDIKPDHFHLWGGAVVLIDLGEGRFIDANLKISTTSIQYASPETFKERIMTTESDIYSLGATFAILFGLFDKDDYSVPLKLSDRFYKDFKIDIPGIEEIYFLIRSMMDHDPKKRPSLNQCLRTIEKLEKNSDYQKLGIIFLEDILKMDSIQQKEAINQLHKHESICLVINENNKSQCNNFLHAATKENICVLGIFNDSNQNREELKNHIISYVDTALYNFVNRRDHDKVTNLLKMTGDPNGMGVNDNTMHEPAIFCALRQNDLESSLILLNHQNFDLNKTNQYGSNLLMFLLQLRKEHSRQSIVNHIIKIIFNNKKLKEQVFDFLNDKTKENQIKQVIEYCLNNKDYFILKEFLSLEKPSSKTAEIFMTYKTKIAAMFRNILVPLPYENTLAEVLLAEKNQQCYQALRA